MPSKIIRKYVEPLLSHKPGGLQSIRIGTKAPAYWPYRFISDRDSGDLLKLFEDVVNREFHLALMVHYSHPRELSTQAAHDALRKIISTGAVVRCQSPIVRYVNDDAKTWANLWRAEVNLAAVPYYMFVARDTGAQHYFGITLERAHKVFADAWSQVSGLARTVRGPSMSTTPGKVLIQGSLDTDSGRAFVLKFIQARNPEWTKRVFLAEYDPDASWLDDLVPFNGEERFFWEDDLGGMIPQIELSSAVN